MLEEATKSVAVVTESSYLNRRQTQFKTKFGIFFSCLGCVVGTGNIWRFPRICASQSASRGSLVFLLVWFAFLCLWSTPIAIVEFTLGRFSQCSPLLSFCKFMGPRFIWMGGWIVCISMFVSFYYSVIIGWTIYYFFLVSTCASLPSHVLASQDIFEFFTRDSYYPVLSHVAAVILLGVCTFGGIRWIEKANLILVPVLLAIVCLNFVWALTIPHAHIGIQFMFTPVWSTILDPNLWIAAISQNAFDTSAGSGAFVAYSTHLSRSQGSVRYAVCIPLCNNLISLIAGVTIFCTVFSTLIAQNPTMTTHQILMILQNSGPAGTALTFIWFPVIFSKYGLSKHPFSTRIPGLPRRRMTLKPVQVANRDWTVKSMPNGPISALHSALRFQDTWAGASVKTRSLLGRFMCSLFFVCLVFSGLTSIISLVQLVSMTLVDLGLTQRWAVVTSLVLMFVCGLPSALSVHFLSYQDQTSGYALVISGAFFSLLVIKYGVERYRERIVNQFGVRDWKLRLCWIPIIAVLVPLQAVCLLAWWMYKAIRSNQSWYLPSVLGSLTSILLEWVLLLSLLLLFTVMVIWRKWDVIQKSVLFGNDPFLDTPELCTIETRTIELTSEQPDLQIETLRNFIGPDLEQDNVTYL
ncbi:hypothetical protein Ciccas_006506 [Cichlidogyrus casuarinus]|uniref:Uncharacterized protein n=1 Tax=Cichlidogyrus casuarinus TaxID=1844966 RepID=A0ABD2Q602_9PLAT